MSIEVLSYPFSCGITAFSTKRGMDVDVTDLYGGYSICDYTGDDENKVKMCRKALCDFLHIPLQNLIVPRQIHSSRVLVLSDEKIDQTGENVYVQGVKNAQAQEVDAVVTTFPNVAIAINTADCVPILLADSENGIIAAIHAGWRGLIGDVIVNTVVEMRKLQLAIAWRKEKGSDERNGRGFIASKELGLLQGAKLEVITAAIGPAICAHCFETSDEIADGFAAKFGSRFISRNSATGKQHVDLPAIAKSQLIACGVAENNVFDAHLCTKCNPQDFFSARRQGVRSGRVASVIMINDRRM